MPFLPPVGPRPQGWTGKCKSGHWECWVGAGVHPLAIGQGQSLSNATGEGRSAPGAPLQPPIPVATAQLLVQPCAGVVRAVCPESTPTGVR